MITAFNSRSTHGARADRMFMDMSLGRSGARTRVRAIDHPWVRLIAYSVRAVGAA
jgi:hypothetical protein